ncbi:MAG: hypothetical protein LBR08_12310, partial [Bacteroidales bacterium]|nr:hypothetical protein [Bacteroidales bacterium]
MKNIIDNFTGMFFSMQPRQNSEQPCPKHHRQVKLMLFLELTLKSRLDAVKSTGGGIPSACRQGGGQTFFCRAAIPDGWGVKKTGAEFSKLRLKNMIAGSPQDLHINRNTHDKKINSDTQGDDYTLRTVWFCALTLPERQDFHNRRRATCGQEYPRQTLPERQDIDVSVLPFSPFGRRALVQAEVSR